MMQVSWVGQMFQSGKVLHGQSFEVKCAVEKSSKRGSGVCNRGRGRVNRNPEK